jgi:Protein of unknown function (DUF3716)
MCKYILGKFGGACGNCKWRDHGSRCVHPGSDAGRSDSEDQEGEGDSGEEEEEEEGGSEESGSLYGA